MKLSNERQAVSTDFNSSLQFLQILSVNDKMSLTRESDDNLEVDVSASTLPNPKRPRTSIDIFMDDMKSEFPKLGISIQGILLFIGILILYNLEYQVMIAHEF